MNRLLMFMNGILLCMTSALYAGEAQAGIAFLVLYFVMYGLAVVQSAIAEFISIRLLLPKLKWEHLIWLVISMNLTSLVIGSWLPLLITILFTYLLPKLFVLDPFARTFWIYSFFLCVVIIMLLKVIVAKTYLLSAKYKVNLTILLFWLLVINACSMALSMFEILYFLSLI